MRPQRGLYFCVDEPGLFFKSWVNGKMVYFCTLNNLSVIMVLHLLNVLLPKTHPYNLGQLLDNLKDTFEQLRKFLIWSMFA